MSTISLMPVGTKIKITKPNKISVYSRCSKTEPLVSAGMVNGDTLILDEGTIIRIDGFSSQYNLKSYPMVRLSVFPEGKKSGKVNTILNELDGLSWDACPENNVAQPQKKIVRVNVEYDSTRYKSYNMVWHSAFSKGYDGNVKKEVMVNPLELTHDEITNRVFYDTTVHYDAGNCVVKIGQSNWNYTIQYSRITKFGLSVPQNGLLSATLVDQTIVLYLKSYNEEEEKLDIDPNQDDKIVISLIESYLKEKHKINE